MHLDDKYTEGVWYDQMNGDFAEIQRGLDDGERIVELVNPETGDVYWDMPVSDWVESEQSGFCQEMTLANCQESRCKRLSTCATQDSKSKFRKSRIVSLKSIPPLLTYA